MEDDDRGTGIGLMFPDPYSPAAALQSPIPGYGQFGVADISLRSTGLPVSAGIPEPPALSPHLSPTLPQDGGGRPAWADAVQDPPPAAPGLGSGPVASVPSSDPSVRGGVRVPVKVKGKGKGACKLHPVDVQAHSVVVLRYAPAPLRGIHYFTKEVSTLHLRAEGDTGHDLLPDVLVIERDALGCPAALAHLAELRRKSEHAHAELGDASPEQAKAAKGAENDYTTAAAELLKAALLKGSKGVPVVDDDGRPLKTKAGKPRVTKGCPALAQDAATLTVAASVLALADGKNLPVEDEAKANGAEAAPVYVLVWDTLPSRSFLFDTSGKGFVLGPGGRAELAKLQLLRLGVSRDLLAYNRRKSETEAAMARVVERTEAAVAEFRRAHKALLVRKRGLCHEMDRLAKPVENRKGPLAPARKRLAEAKKELEEVGADLAAMGEICVAEDAAMFRNRDPAAAPRRGVSAETTPQVVARLLWLCAKYENNAARGEPAPLPAAAAGPADEAAEDRRTEPHRLSRVSDLCRTALWFDCGGPIRCKLLMEISLALRSHGQHAAALQALDLAGQEAASLPAGQAELDKIELLRARCRGKRTDDATLKRDIDALKERIRKVTNPAALDTAGLETYVHQLVTVGRAYLHRGGDRNRNRALHYVNLAREWCCALLEQEGTGLRARVDGHLQVVQRESQGNHDESDDEMVGVSPAGPAPGPPPPEPGPYTPPLSSGPPGPAAPPWNSPLDELPPLMPLGDLLDSVGHFRAEIAASEKRGHEWLNDPSAQPDAKRPRHG